MNDVKVNEVMLESLLVYAFRYALGRMTYSVWDVGQALIKHKDVLNKHTKELIRKEIKEAVWHGEAGMDCDVAVWSDVYAELVEDEQTK